MQRRRRAAALALLVVLPLLGAADLAAAVALPHHHDRPVAAPATSTLPPVTPTVPAVSTTARRPVAPVSPADVSGTVTAVHLVGATGAPLSMPITITIPNRGQGALNIDGVVVMGHPGAQVAWDGGQPLPITGDGTLALGAATLDANPAGITWHLDGLPRYFGPGSYTAESSVAVGTGGLALAVDQVGFTVTAGSQGQLETDGDAQVHFGPRPFDVSGPGLIQLLGALSVTTASGTRTVHNLHAGSGAFSLAFVPVSGGFTVRGTVAGPLTFP